MIAVDSRIDQADGRNGAASFGGGSAPADERNCLATWSGAGGAFVGVVVMVEIGCSACIDHAHPALCLAKRYSARRHKPNYAGKSPLRLHLRPEALCAQPSQAG